MKSKKAKLVFVFFVFFFSRKKVNTTQDCGLHDNPYTSTCSEYFG